MSQTWSFIKRKKLFPWSMLTCSAFLILSILYLLAASRIDRKDLILPDNSLFFDRSGSLLRFLPDEKGERHIRISGNDIPGIVKNAFIAGEDKRFYVHHGFDIAAIFRALKDNIRNRKIVSGASTITQQVIRLTFPRERTYRDKFIEILRSIRLETILSKEEILELYLNMVPMGNNIIGIELASRTYFGKTSRELTAAEAALLASLPKAPGYLNPYGKNRVYLLKRKNWVLSRMAKKGYLTEKELKDAMEYQIVFQEISYPFHAPHLVNLLIKRGKGTPGRHYTTIDLNVQREVSEILKSHEVRLSYRGASQTSAIVVNNQTMEVLVSVGSLSYSSKNKGFNNGTAAFRSAGSTLKPLIYAEALESGYTVASLLQDTLRKYRTPKGDYSPNNYDRREYGPVTMRSALGNSLNISAIKMLEELGIDRFYQVLNRVNLINDPSKRAGHYGLGLVLGNPEVSLEALVAVYAMLANSGLYRPLQYLKGAENSLPAERIFSVETAYIISDILSDPSARVITFGNTNAMNFPFRVSLKTGTSTKFRDGWAIGYTPEYTVGVWAGNFQGNPTYSLSGAEGAAPIFKDIINLLYKKTAPSTPLMPERVMTAKVCGISGMKPTPYCNYVARELFIKGTEPEKDCIFHTRKGLFHELPATYASWLFEKNQKGLAGSYRMKGFSTTLDNVFQNEWARDALSKETPGIRIRKGSQKVNLAKDVVTAPSVEKKHYSIGNNQNDIFGYETYTDNQLIISYPLPKDRFILNREVIQAIKLKAVSKEPVDYIDWFIDSMHYARVGPPYHTHWVLKRGLHTISAVSPNNSGDSISIMVE